MIKSVELENFKAFKKSGEVDLKKINIFVGPNSSGKSSFIKALLTLKNTVDSADTETILNFNEDVGNFKSVVYKKDVRNCIKYKLNFLENDSIKKFTLNDVIFKIINRMINKDENDEHDLKYYLVEVNKNSRLFKLKSIEFSVKSYKDDRMVIDELNINYYNEKNIKIKRDRASYYIYVDSIKIDEANIVVPKKFLFTINEKKITKKLDINELQNIALLEFALMDVEKQLNEFVSKIKHIEPLRNKFNRVEYVTSLKANNSVGNRGENTVPTLVGLGKEQSNSKVSKINMWLDKFDLGQNVGVKNLGNDSYSLFIKNKYTGIECNILDVGVGTSQLLPIVIESINSDDDSILIIEEPESHIHPTAQSKLAELFVDIVSTQNKKFLIETHSIFLIVQL